MKSILIFVVFIFYTSNSCTDDKNSVQPDDYLKRTYINPVGDISGIGDPFVLKYDDRYYMYCTSNAQIGFKVWESSNLVDWTAHEFAFDSRIQEKQWTTGSFWAPEVIFYDNQFYMTYSAKSQSDGKLKIALARSSTPKGPFKDFRVPLLDNNFSCIDGHIFIDDDGTPYLYYSKDCSENIINGNHVSQIYVQQMTPENLSPVGDPILCISPSQPWEHPSAEWQWNEGPFVLKNDNIYYLMYSANYFASFAYSIGYAISMSPTGPWQKSEHNPVLAGNSSIGVSGPGHNSVTVSPDSSELFIVYHTHTDPAKPSGNRQPNIDRINIENGRLKIIGPTRSPQPMPNCNPKTNEPN